MPDLRCQPLWTVSRHIVLPHIAKTQSLPTEYQDFQ